jgi:hypothetical protein
MRDVVFDERRRRGERGEEGREGELPIVKLFVVSFGWCC